MRGSGVMVVKLVLTVVALVALPPTHDALTVGYYSLSCPNAEALVKQAVREAFAVNAGIAPGLIRMHFHDCFVRGCEASVLLDGAGTEKMAIPNLSLRGFEVIDAAKAAIEAECPGTVSCADILTFAARDSAELSGGITWPVPAGRRDGFVSRADETIDLPPPSFNASSLIDSFAKKNLNADEMVTLSGAHSIGRAHCAAFSDRLYETNTSGVDPTLSSAYADLLRLACPEEGASPDTTVKMDIITPDILDNKYYIGVLNNLGLFTSDHALVTEGALEAAVRFNAHHPLAWRIKFILAMVKMGGIEVLEGSEGEIRTDCKVVNPMSQKGSSSWAIQ